MTKAAMVDVVGVGLNATDMLIPLPEYPAPGSKIEFRNASFLPGGQVASAVMACQSWGLRTRYVGKLGEDDAARLHRSEFARAGVDAQVIAVPGCPSQQAVILVDRHGERTVLWRRDPQLSLRPDELDREWIVNARALHVDGYDTAAATLAATWARASGIPVVADLDDVYAGVQGLLENIDYAIVSKNVPARLVGEDDLEKALPLMQRRFDCVLTAATLGEDGVLAWDGKQFHYAPAFQVDAVDTTGAGDTFHAGFIYGLLQGWKLPRILDFACAAAALNCMGVGARGGIKPVKEIEKLMTSGLRYSPLLGVANLG